MAQIKVNIPGFQEHDGNVPIVILGPNGSGKTQLAQKISQNNQVSAISAQRRTWVDDNLPVQDKTQLRNNIQSQIKEWQRNSWRPTEEINFILSTLIQDHTSILTQRNEQAISAKKALEPVNDTKLILLQQLWSLLFPMRKLEIGGYFPRVKRLEASASEQAYQLRQMSDGERTVLYMATRVLTAEQSIILVDEPELHMHSRLAITFWDEAEKLRPDCRFVYVTHDLNFALSRRNAIVLVAKSNESAEPILVDELPSSVATEVLGAATLPFYSKRIVMFEGESGKGFASEFFSAWFDSKETFAIPAGDRNSVYAAISGLKTVGVVAAEIVGLVDRDFYPDSVLNNVSDGVIVLSLHEIESVLCDQKVISAVSKHLGKDPEQVWDDFLARVKKEFQGQTLNNIVAKRVRSRVGDLLNGAFNGAQVNSDLHQTAENHNLRLSELDLPAKTSAMFTEEFERVQTAITNGNVEILAILPGKHLLGLLPNLLGLNNTAEYASLIIRALNRQQVKEDDPLLVLGQAIEMALLAYLPPRSV